MRQLIQSTSAFSSNEPCVQQEQAKSYVDLGCAGAKMMRVMNGLRGERLERAQQIKQMIDDLKSDLNDDLNEELSYVYVC